MNADSPLLIGHPALWSRSVAVRDPRQPEVRALETRLAFALERQRALHPELISLGAPQIGSSLRVCRIHLGGASDAVTLINPWVVEASLETVEHWEVCASIPDLRIGVRRFRRVTVEYVDMTGSGRSVVAEGPDAALLQHEIDHFNGFLATDRLSDAHRIEHRLARAVAPVLAEHERD
jgi:peptide deformylase